MFPERLNIISRRFASNLKNNFCLDEITKIYRNMWCKIEKNFSKETSMNCKIKSQNGYLTKFRHTIFMIHTRNIPISL